MSRGGRESRGSRELDSLLIANEIVHYLQLHEIVSRPPGDERKQEESDSTVNAFTIRLLLAITTMLIDLLFYRVIAHLLLALRVTQVRRLN